MDASSIEIQRLGVVDVDKAARTLTMMAEVFEEPHAPLGDAYLRRLLARRDFFLLAACEDDRPVGGLTAHALPLTRVEATELFIYDLAVDGAHQRRGIGRSLVRKLIALGEGEGIKLAWVPADHEDQPALDFYRSLGASESAVSIFSFGSAE